MGRRKIPQGQPLPPELANAPARGVKFTKENAKEMASRPRPSSSIRHQLREISQIPIDMNDIDNEIKRLIRLSGPNCSIARLSAIRAWEKILKKMPDQMYNNIIDQVDGPHIVRMQEVPPDEPMPTSFSTEEEAAAAFAKRARDV